MRASSVELTDDPAQGAVAARGVAASVQVIVPLAGLVDFEAARGRLRKDLDRVVCELETRSRKLNNAKFLERAPSAVVERERELKQQLAERRSKLEANLELLGSESSSS